MQRCSDDAPRVRAVDVDDEHDGTRLDNFLTAVLPDLSRSQVQRLIKEGLVTGGTGRFGRARAVRAGQTLLDRDPAPTPATPEPEDLPLRIVYEDPDIVVLDKPAGMVVHPAAGHSTRHARQRAAPPRHGPERHRRRAAARDRAPARSRHVGLMVVAKHDQAHQELSRQFRDREVEKEYVALVWGVVQAGTRIDAPIGRDPKDRQKMSTRARRARSAVTRVTWSRHFHGVSLLKVAIATGRTHQIRVHLSAIGHPIVGDSVYGGVHRRVADDLRPVMRLERPFLHSARLSFTHPATAAGSTSIHPCRPISNR